MIDVVRPVSESTDLTCQSCGKRQHFFTSFKEIIYKKGWVYVGLRFYSDLEHKDWMSEDYFLVCDECALGQSVKMGRSVERMRWNCFTNLFKRKAEK